MLSPYFIRNNAWYDIGLLPFLFIIGALLPDIDTASYIENYTYLFLSGLIIGLIVIKKYLPAAIVGLLGAFIKTGKHRGMTHGFIFFILVSAPFFYYKPIYGIAIFSGMVLHKICDW